MKAIVSGNQSWARDNFFIFATTTNETMCQGASVNCNNVITFSQQTKQQSTIYWPCNIVAEIVASAQLRQRKNSNLGTHGTSPASRPPVPGSNIGPGPGLSTVRSEGGRSHCMSKLLLYYKYRHVQYVQIKEQNTRPR